MVKGKKNEKKNKSEQIGFSFPQRRFRIRNYQCRLAIGVRDGNTQTLRNWVFSHYINSINCLGKAHRNWVSVMKQRL
jgi:hypothetical protein